MRDFLKKIFRKLSNTWYGILPILILVGIPIAICVAIRWKHIPKTMGVLSDLGGGSWLFGILLLFFSIIGLVSIVYAVIHAVEVIAKKLGNKWAIWYIIATSLGMVALKIIIERANI